MKHLTHLHFLPPILMAIFVVPGAPDILAGAAAGIHILSRARTQFGRAAIAAATVTVLSVWLPLPVVCLLAGIYATEALFADNFRMRVARIITTALCMHGALFIINIHYLGAPELTIHFAIAAILAAAGLLFAAAGRRTLFDPLLCALASLLFLSFALAIGLLASLIGSFPLAVAAVTATYCAVLAIVSLLVAPMFADGHGFQSAAQAFALDVPLDKWITILSSIAADAKSADDFLADAAKRMHRELPGADGIEWQIEGGEKQQSGGGRHPMKVSCPPLVITFYRRRFATPWAWFGHYLLCRVVSEHYLSKRREEEQRAQNLLYAVHQTGARITHDIKNILHVLSALAATNNADTVRRQLPVLRNRLETALGKLHAPSAQESTMPAAAWWEEAKSRHAAPMLTLADADDALAKLTLPAALFDRALDNLIENALRKHQTSPFTVRAVLFALPEGAALRVTDNGAPVPPETAKKLFISPVPSSSGFGVALYQLADEAARHNYYLALEENKAGAVSFVLLPRAAGNKPEPENKTSSS